MAIKYHAEIFTAKLSFVKDEICFQLIEVSEIDSTKFSMIKILMFYNPKKANPYGLRRFVKNLRFILIEKRGYDFAWGCPLEVDDSRYPLVGVDKRFKMHRELTFADEDEETHKVIVSRLAATWEAAGMILMPVPDDLIGAAFCSDKYRDHLLKKNKFMNQFLAPITPPT